MNQHQALAQQRAQRRFSTGDGVMLPDGRGGVVRGHDGRGGLCIAVDGQTTWVSAKEDDVTSAPQFNTGKYGGPARGGAPAGWCGRYNCR